METSQLRFYSVGIVAANKLPSSRHVEIMPVESLPFLEGELNTNPTIQEASGVNALGENYTVKVVADNTLNAEWLAMANSNRRTAPDVRRGERVVIWQYADADKFYWTSLGMDDHLRKLETVVFTVSDTQDESKDATDPANCYSVEISTHTGQITVQTVKANGEPFAYTFQFNTKDGAVVLTDDVGNYAELNSAKTLIRVMNQMGTFLELNKRNINAYAPQDITAEAKRNVSFKAGKNATIKAGVDFTAEAGNNANMKAGTNAIVDGGAMAMLKSGGSFIQFTPAGGKIKAPKMEGGS